MLNKQDEKSGTLRTERSSAYGAEKIEREKNLRP